MIGRLIGIFFSLLGLAIMALLITLRVRYGGGADFPDRSTHALLAPTVLEKVADLPLPPGNVAVSADGRVLATLHPEGRPKVHVVEIVKGQMEPWPSAEFQQRFRDPLSLRIDAQGRVWVLDPGHHGIDGARLLAFDLKSGEVVHEYAFPGAIAGYGSHLNDFQVSPDGKFVYIADASFFGKKPALVIYDVDNKAARRVLENDVSTRAEDYTPIVRGRRMVAYSLVAIRPGVDSITLDAKGDWLYFGAVTSRRMYRAHTADLRNAELSRGELAGKVEAYADKTMSDGISIDNAGALYLGDPEHDAVQLLKPDRTLQTLVKSAALRWPDGFSFGPDGWLYVTCSSLHEIIGIAPWLYAQNAPYQIYRFKAGASGVPGH